MHGNFYTNKNNNSQRGLSLKVLSVINKKHIISQNYRVQLLFRSQDIDKNEVHLIFSENNLCGKNS